jgi:hypothetical protein
MYEGGCEKSHPIFIGSMELSKIGLGKSVSQENKKERKLVWVEGSIIKESHFCMERSFCMQILGQQS